MASATPGPGRDAVATAHPLATEAGLAVLAHGGNAFDAAVAISAALAVVEPFGSGIGGGGFWLLHRAADGRQVMVDGRERAPLAATPDMYLDAAGNPIDRASIDGPLAAGIPGTPAALGHIAAGYGRLPLAVTLQPAILLAEHGFPVDEVYRRLAGWRLEALRDSAAARDIFLVDGDVPPLGHRLRQPDLAETLRAMAARGPAAFYAGPVGERLLSGVRESGGIWRAGDLASYRVVERRPSVSYYRGHRIVSASLPSSGGVVMTQILNMLNALPTPDSEVQRLHQLIESTRRAFEDRASYLGDPDYVDVPLRRLLSATHARERLADFDPNRATPSTDPTEQLDGGDNTTHFSVLDRDGNRVAATLSLNYPFGSGFVPPGTGVLLNDEMDDFSTKPGVANAYGLLGGTANAIEPGKRMLSSMSPTFVEGPDRVTVLGTPGGSRIITMVLLGVLDSIAGTPVDALVARGRFHHQWLPDRVDVEPDALQGQVEALQEMGHEIRRLSRPYGNLQAIAWERRGGAVTAASDPRGIGLAVVTAPTPTRH